MADVYIKTVDGGETTSPTGSEGIPLDDGTTSTWISLANIAEYIRTLAQTLTNKTLTAPTIADFTNANHDHADADSGGAVVGGGGGDLYNYLINGGFDFAQRQAPATLTTIADKSWGADRWQQFAENASWQYNRNDATGESGLTSKYYGLFKKITSTGKGIFVQKVEGVNSIPLRSKTVVFQIKMKASASKTIRMGILELQTAGTVDTFPAALASAFGADATDPTWGTNVAVITGAESKSVTTSWQSFSVSVTVPSNSKNVVCAIWTDSQFAANDTLSVAEAGLFVSSTIQAWKPRLITDEHNLCMRFYEVGQEGLSPTRSSAYDLEMTLISNTTTNGTQYGQWAYLIAKRVDPTVTIHPYTTGTDTAKVSNSTGTDLAANSGVSVGGINRLAVQNSSGGTVTTNGLILFKYEANAEIA